jgi:hypothetical protein
VSTSTAEYAVDAGANFVIQALLRRLTAELTRKSEYLSGIIAEGGSIKSMAKSERAVLKRLCSQALAVWNELTSDEGVFESLVRSRGGVVMWLIQCAAGLDAMVGAFGDEDIAAAGYSLDAHIGYASKVCGMLFKCWTGHQIEKGEEIDKDKIAALLSKALEAKTMPVSQQQSSADASASAGAISAQLLTCKIFEVIAKHNITTTFSKTI